MTDRFDVIVVGAGPAGSTAARFAAESNARVLFFDKRKIIGVPVQCGEFLPSNEELKDILPSIDNIEEVLDKKITDRLVQKQTKKIIIISPKGREYEIDFDGYTVNRNEFDQTHADLAVKKGATLLKDTRFIRLRGKRVITSRGEFEGSIVVAADGPHSRVCLSAGLSRIAELSPALTCQVKGDFDDSVSMFFSKKIAPGGYAWVIPKKGCANVGLGIQKSKIPINRLLVDFLKKHNFKTKKINVGFVPVSGPINRSVKGNVLAVGDAAGQVMATNGGGIPIAMICGRIAGKVAAEYALKGSDLSRYEKEWRAVVGNELETAVRTKKLADKFFRADFLLEFTMKRLGVEGLEKAIKCRKVFGK